MRRALTFGDRTVSDIMVPRTETAFLPTSSTVGDAIRRRLAELKKDFDL